MADTVVSGIGSMPSAADLAAMNMTAEQYMQLMSDVANMDLSKFDASGLGNLNLIGGTYSGPKLAESEYLYTAPLSNKGNPTSLMDTGGNTFAVMPGQEVRLVDTTTGQIIYQGTGKEAASNIIQIAADLSESKGNKAGWEIQTGKGGVASEYGGTTGEGTPWTTVAKEKVNTSALTDIANIAGTILPIAMIPLTMGASAPLAGLSTAGNIALGAGVGAASAGLRGQDILKGGITGGLSAAGSELLGPLIQSAEGAGKVATNLGSALGTGAGSFAGNVITGQSLKNSLLNAGIATAGDYLIGEAFGSRPSEYDDLMKWAKEYGIFEYTLPDGTVIDLSPSTGGGSGTGGGNSGGRDIVATGTNNTVTSGIGGTTGGITVTGTRDGGVDRERDTSTASGTGITVSPTPTVTGTNTGTPSGTGITVSPTPTQTGTNTGTPSGTGITVSPTPTQTGTNTGTPSGTGITVSPTPTQTGTNTGTPSGTGITVSPTPTQTGTNTGTPSGTGITVSPTPTQTGTNTGTPSGSVTVSSSPTPSGTKKWTWKDWARLGLLAPTLIKGLGDLLDSGDGSEVITPDQSRVSFTPMNRERGIGSFDPFTYGQAGPGYQTAEFEFFKPAPTAAVTQTYTPATVQTVGGTPRYQYTQEQVDALNAATMNAYNQNLAKFNAYQDELAKQVEAGTLTLDQAIKQANTFGAGLGSVAPVTAAEGGLIELPDELSGFIDEYTGLDIGTDEYRKLSKQDRTLLRNYDIQRRKLQAEQQRKSIAENEAKRLAREAAQPYFARGDIDREIYEQARRSAQAEQTAARKAAQDSVRAEYSSLIDAARAEREAAAERNAALYGDLNNASISSALNKAMYAQGASEDARLAAQRELSSPMLYGQRDIRGGADIGNVMNIVSRYATPAQLNAALDIGGRKGKFMPFNSYNAGITEANTALNDILSRYEKSLQDVRSQYSKPLAFDWPTVGQMKIATGMAEGGEMNDDMISHLIEYRKGGGHHGPGPVNGIGSGQEDKIPAWLSDGEYVWSAQDVADLGDGSTNEGVRRLDKMRQMVRKRAGRKNVKKIAKPQQGIEQMLKAVGSKA